MDGHDRAYPLHRRETRIGRGDDNDIILSDLVASREHAVIDHDGDSWWLRDLGSRYGVRVNDELADGVELRPGDVLTIGTVDFTVESLHERTPAPTPPVEALPHHDPSETERAHIVRTMDGFEIDHGLVPATSTPTTGAGPTTTEYSARAVGQLTHLAQELLPLDDLESVATRTLETAFALFPIQRGWVLFTDAEGRIVDRLARVAGDLHHPEGELPISSSVVRRVIDERVAVVTGDAQGEVAETNSMIIHGIRSAMCAPLWSREQVEGVLYVDTTELATSFDRADLDLLTAVANLAAVAVQGVRRTQQAERDRIARQHLERYHSPGLIEALVRDESMSRLRTAEVTVMFADVVGFTTSSAELTPDGVAELLDGFFNEAVDAVFAHDGTLDKFIGDAVMAFFGAPLPLEDHAERAMRTALDLRFRLKRWNSQHVAGGGRPVDIRIALNSGPVVVGDVGSHRRVDYTVLGNTVNVAARLEGVGGPGDIVVGPGTRALLPDDFPLSPLGDLELKGLKQPVPAWRVATAVV